MIDLLVKGKIFGCVRCFMYSVEWQKRGLPHAHILIWIETKIRDEQIDDVIRAELPDQEVDPQLFDVVKTHMVHGPCGSYNPRSPCMKNGICSKRFPKPFSTETVTDLAVFGVQNANDEVTSYQNGRHISTSEAIWRMLSFSIHERFPAVTHLDIHLENGPRIYFDPSNVRTVVENPRNTTLMAFFDCAIETNSLPLYCMKKYQVITHLINKMEHIFQRRRRGTPVEGHPRIFHEHTLGRIYTIHTNNRECYHLRMLLNVVKGPTSFESLKSVNGILCPTYQAACLALGLLEGDNPWCDTLTDASISTSVSKLRELFAIILVFCNVSNPSELWSKFKDHFTEDYVRDFQRHYPDADINAQLENFSNRVLFALQDVLLSIGGNTLPHYGLPSPQAIDGIVGNLNREYFEHKF
ncbi:ATP-dependent DNA helicase [Trichonephila clavipes]|nr:ATP-dependent DNA helicase [Trichonephila clavipes]